MATTTSSGAWASEPSHEPSRAPWRAEGDDDAGRTVVVDALGQVVARFGRRRDAAYVLALVNGEQGPPRPMMVRFIDTDTWLGSCHYCEPSHLLLGASAMSTLAQLHEHFHDVHYDALHEHEEEPGAQR